MFLADAALGVSCCDVRYS